MDRCKQFLICGLPAQDPEGFCILHSKDEGKDRESFQNELKDYLEKGSSLLEGFTFPEGTSKFLRKTFEKGGSFNWSVFKGWASFDEVSFLQKTSFHGVTFQKEVSFNGTTFKGESSFRGVTFHGGTSFDEADFDGETNFDLSNFLDEASFRRVTFHDLVSCNGTSFHKGVSFQLSSFKKGGHFIQGEEALFREKCNFASIHLEKPELLRFERANLVQTSLLRTPLRKVEFVDVVWSNLKPTGRIGIYDEKGAKKENLPLVEDLYRQLKLNYEERGDHEKAGNFHYGEKEMMRKRRSFFRDPFLWFYWLLSGYSERVGRSTLWLALLILAGGFTYRGIGFNDSFLHSLKVVLLPHLQSSEHFNSRLGLWFEVFQFIFGKIQIALTVLALTQRLRR